MLAETPTASAVEGSQALTGAADDRRIAPRLRTVFWVAKITSDHDVGLWRVHNISDTGIMLRTQCEVTPGEPLSIALSDRCVVNGIVRWYEKQCCGVEFEHEIDSEGVLAALAAERKSNKFRPPRLPVSRGATAYCETGIRPVRLFNVSQHGIGIAHDGRIEPDMRIMLTLENGVERRGIVRWSKNGHSGLMLFDPFCSTDLESRNRF